MLLLLATSNAMAENTGWYVGANMGQSQATIDDARITNGLFANGLTSQNINGINRDLGYKVFAGYKINKNFAIEAGYFYLGQFGFNTNTTPLGTLSGETKLNGLNLDALGILPVTEKLSVFGRIGVTHTQANDSFVGTGAVNVLNPNPSSRDTNLKAGLGLQYALNDALTVRAEIERYRINDAVGNKGDVDILTVGLIYRLGVKATPP
jgi:OOP family OmpA-OmpF porin